MTGKSLALIGWIILFAVEGPGTIRSQDEPPAVAPAPAGRNRLAKETSPYLLLHADNPVDWYPWGPEAFARAKAEDKPIFLSIGYSSCYWCHVMERESFESEAIAKLLNENFICIKVDREERPDVDQVYMVAAQAFGRGGWPLSAFLTPDGRPFFAGTYYPPTDRDGLPGFSRVLAGIKKAWGENRKAIDGTAGDMVEFIKKGTAPAGAPANAPLSRAMCASGRAWLSREFDPEYGGFGYDPANARIPKFPEPSNILFLLDQHRREKAGQAVPILPPSPLMLAPAPDRSPLEMALTTLDRMARGGIRDQIGGGYHRYSVSRYWIVPHFEKMLYDNAQIASALIAARELTGDERWGREAIDTLDFVLRDMTTPEGGFMSAIDAESEGVEGKSYVWTRPQVDEVLGKGGDAETFLQVYGLKRPPNFEDDRYVLLQPRPLADQAKALGISAEELEGKLKPLRAKLLAARGRRAAPLKDDKVITAWNGLMIAALAEGARAFGDDRYREAAGRAADLLLGLAAKDGGRLPRVYRGGKAKGPAYLEDYAFLAWGLIRLYEATGDRSRLDQARALADRMVADYSDEARGGFFFTSKDLDDLIARPKDPTDGVLPGGNSVAVRVLARLGREQKREADLDLAGRSLGGFAGPLQQRPGSSPHLLIALEEYFDARPDAAKAPAPTPPPASAAIVSAKAEVKGDVPVAPGSEVEAVLTLTIKEGWHIYANPPRPANLKGTTIEPGPEAKVAALRAKWPRGEDKVLASSGAERVGVYEGTIEVPVRLRLPDDAPAGPAAIPLRVKFQPCDDKVCLAPASLDLTLAVMVQAPPAP